MYGLRRGRINRATYWLCLVVISAIFAAIIALTGKRVPFGEIALIVLCVPRLHDIGQSGWWVGGMIIAEIAVMIAALASLPEDQALAVLGLFGLLILVGLVVLGALPGQPGPNRFGPPPAPGLSFGRSEEGPEKQF
jgi:uncharacterized membrane protein YhaH (DUF805 family)